MLKSWSIENFKAIINSGDLKLAPVTVLAGKNSSGKSSLLQSILMIAQTLSNQIPDRALLPNERIVQLGTFEDILNEKSNSRTLTVKFEVSDEAEDISQNSYVEWDQKVVVRFGSASGRSESSSAIEASKVVVEDLSIDLFEYFDELEYKAPVSEENSLEEMLPQTFFSFNSHFVVKRIFGAEFKRFWESANPDIISVMPSSYMLEKTIYIGEFEEDLPFSDDDVTGASEPAKFLVTLSHFLPTKLINIGKKNSVHVNVFADVNLDNAVEKITRFFTSKIRYLGPLRADPNTIQRSFAPTSELDEVGSKGEYSAAVYHSNQNAPIQWYNPRSGQVEQGTLQRALDTWAQYLGVASHVRTEMAGTSGVTWMIVPKNGQKARTLPEVGVGVSQVLPILVMGLLSPKNTLLILEQPELHLHPMVQARLGDFFVGLSKCNKQCLIETHSENLISQLRYHIVQAGGQDKSDCMIYFVDQDAQGAAKFEPVEISPQGNILNWPDGFFDETMLQEDRITAASLKKRANKVKHG